MIKDIGRLDALETKKIEDYLNDVFDKLDKGQDNQAIELLEELCKTNNYFLRELVGRLLTNYKNQQKMEKIAAKNMTSKVYGIRATALFYFFNKYLNKPDKLVTLLENYYESVPWEVESIIYELWKKSPKITKEMAPKWLESDDEKKRMLSFHGLELIVETDTPYVLDFISKAIDDPSVEVQKKITHIILQIIKIKPAETYAYIREWIMTGSETRIKNLLVTLKKIVSLSNQKNQRDKPPDFITLTNYVIYDWKSDPVNKVSNAAAKLLQNMRRESKKY